MYVSFLKKLIFKSYVDRRKSLQETPPRTLDDRGMSPFTGHYSGYTGAYSNNGHYGLNYGGYGVSNASRYEDEIYNAFYPTSSSTANNSQVLKKNLIYDFKSYGDSHHRFDIYRTRAERDAERNTAKFVFILYKQFLAPIQAVRDVMETNVQLPLIFHQQQSIYQRINHATKTNQHNVAHIMSHLHMNLMEMNIYQWVM